MTIQVEGLTLSASETVQKATIRNPQQPSTLKNDDTSKTLFFKYHYNEAEPDAGTAAELRTATWGELKAGEATVIKGAPSLYYVVATGSTSLSARIVPGVMVDATAIAVEANIGNVGLLDAAESEINPAKEDGNLLTINTAAEGTRYEQILKSTTVPTPATTGAAWDNAGGTGYMDLGTTTLEIHVSVDENTYLICNNTAAQYSGQDPTAYPGGQAHRIPCRGQRYLHHKQVSAPTTVNVTPFIAATP
jgi:hypothetical protein